MEPQDKEQKPWYRQRWPWLLMIGALPVPSPRHARSQSIKWMRVLIVKRATNWVCS